MTIVPSSTAALEGLPLPKLDHVDLVTVRLPFVAPFGTSVYTWTHKEALFATKGGCPRKGSPPLFIFFLGGGISQPSKRCGASRERD